MATLIDSYSESNQDTNTVSLYQGWYSDASQSFTSTGGVLNSCKMNLAKAGTPPGTMVAVLYTHSGTYGTGTPTGAYPGGALAISDTVSTSVLSTSFALITFTFSGANKYPMTNGANYFIGIRYNDASSNASNIVYVGMDTSSPTHAGNFCRRNDATQNWVNQNTWDAPFYVYKDDVTTTVAGASIQANMNALAGTTGLSTQDAANTLAGTTGLSVQSALATKYSKTGSIQDIINQQVNDGNIYTVQDGLSKL